MLCLIYYNFVLFFFFSVVASGQILHLLHPAIWNYLITILFVWKMLRICSSLCCRGSWPASKPVIFRYVTSAASKSLDSVDVEQLKKKQALATASPTEQVFSPGIIQQLRKKPLPPTSLFEEEKVLSPCIIESTLKMAKTKSAPETITVGKLLKFYSSLAKLRLTGLVVCSAVAGYAMAPLSTDMTTLTICLVGTALTSASANTINQFFEIPFDSQMARTSNRVLVRGLLRFFFSFYSIHFESEIRISYNLQLFVLVLNYENDFKIWWLI